MSIKNILKEFREEFSGEFGHIKGWNKDGFVREIKDIEQFIIKSYQSAIEDVLKVKPDNQSLSDWEENIKKLIE